MDTVHVRQGGKDAVFAGPRGWAVTTHSLFFTLGSACATSTRSPPPPPRLAPATAASDGWKVLTIDWPLWNPPLAVVLEI